MVASRSQMVITGGFADPVLGTQAAFRKIMDAFARPGTTIDLSGLVEAPAALPPAAAVLLATLADADAPVFLETANPDIEGWLAFQTGAPILPDPADAAFVFLSSGSAAAGWDRFPLGTDAYPDRSATLLLSVYSLEDGAALQLTGPGIESEHRIAPCGLPTDFLAAHTANSALFPRGHDLVLVAGAQCLALPRTTRISEA